MRARAFGLLLGFAADRALGDPRRGHPVAAFGTLALRAERAGYADTRAAGVRHTACLVGAATLLGLGVESLGRRHPAAQVGLTAVATWTVLGGRSLEREALAVHDFLADGDLPGARARLTHLVSRDTSGLSEAQVARAVVESVAENSSDAVVAPLVWGVLAGVPGLLAYRAANTLDAMVGYRNARHERFGWASARLDDLLNLPGARLGGLCVLLAQPTRAGQAWQAWRRDAAAHPSPNAGVVEACFAGALGIRLGGVNDYGGIVEERATMGRGPAPRTADVERAVRLARRVGILAALLAALLGAGLSGAAGLARTAARRPGARRPRRGRPRG